MGWTRTKKRTRTFLGSSKFSSRKLALGLRASESQRDDEKKRRLKRPQAGADSDRRNDDLQAVVAEQASCDRNMEYGGQQKVAEGQKDGKEEIWKNVKTYRGATRWLREAFGLRSSKLEVLKINLSRIYRPNRSENGHRLLYWSINFELYRLMSGWCDHWW